MDIRRIAVVFAATLALLSLTAAPALASAPTPKPHHTIVITPEDRWFGPIGVGPGGIEVQWGWCTIYVFPPDPHWKDWARLFSTECWA